MPAISVYSLGIWKNGKQMVSIPYSKKWTTVEHRYKEHLIPKHKIRYNHNFIIKELQWNMDITTGCKDRFVITINSL